MPPLGEATTAGGGFAILPLDYTMIRAGQPGMLPEFDGYLTVDGGADSIPLQIHSSRPLLDHQYRSERTQSREALLAIFAAKGVTLDKSRALFYFFPLDCVYSTATEVRAKGVTIEVWTVDAQGFHLCPDCRVAYPADDGLADVTISDYSSRSSGAAVASVPPGEVMAVMRDTKTRLPVSVLRPINARAGYQHYVFLFPASKAQLAMLPANAQ